MKRILLKHAAKASQKILVYLLITMIPIGATLGHGSGVWAAKPLDWSNDQIGKVVSIGNSSQLVLTGGKKCIAGGAVSFDVRENFAFDIDEAVWIEIEFLLSEIGSTLSLTYDGSATGSEIPSHRKLIVLPKAPRERRHTQNIRLERARFADLLEGADFAISAVDAGADGLAKPLQQFTICNILVRRSYTTPLPKTFGSTTITVLDEDGSRTPARMGIYDVSGRLPLPSDDAIKLRSVNGVTRVVTSHPGLPSWPIKNRAIFYTDGHYHSHLPSGNYNLIVAKGPEYRISQHRFQVGAGTVQTIEVKLQRWTDMAARGWYSGEDHIHYARDGKLDDQQLLLLTRAEDLRVANILQMGNSATTYFTQYNWAPVWVTTGAPFALVTGQEDPRTSHRGHAIALNIKQPVRDPSRYLLYHMAFEDVHEQGGLVGYAHVTDRPEDQKLLNALRGMAIDVPFGLVDFVEVLSGEFVGDATWFDFLNLGYKLAPSAGTDYPFGGVFGTALPGSVRNYVNVEGKLTLKSWFDSLKEGRTFVTRGPMLELSINGQGMGSQLHINRGDALHVEARAMINADTLFSLELIEQGELVQRTASRAGRAELQLRHNAPAMQSTWFVLRARGYNNTVLALSGPIYISVDGERSWKRSAVPLIVEKLKREMGELLRPGQLERVEAWEARAVDAKYWDTQHGLLKERIDQASIIYDDLMRCSTNSSN